MGFDLMAIRINIFSIPPLIASFLLLFLAIFVYLNNKRSKLNITLSLECLTSFIWLFGYSIVYIFPFTESMSAFFMKISYAGVIFIPIFLYHFEVEFFQEINKRIFAYIAYGIGILFVFILFTTRLLIDGVTKYFWGYYPRVSIIHPIFLMFFIGLLGLTVYDFLVGSLKRSVLFNGKKKIQARYLFLAYLLYSPACLDFIANYGIPLYPAGYIFSIIFLFIVAYVIVRHQLMDIEILIKKTLIFTGIFTSVYAVFAFFAFLGQIFFERFITQNRWIAMIPSVVVVTIMLRPLENFLMNVTDKYLFQKKYNYKELLTAFTSEVLTVLELDKLIRLTEERLTEIMKLKSCRFVEIALEKMGQSPPALNEVEGPGTVPIFSELKIPIVLRGQTIGALLLGRKKSDEDYTQEDLDILQPLAKALGIAISNAKLLEELGKAQVEAAQKDKMATIGTLAAGMAHEIRNPITTIRNFADYLPERHGDKDFMDKFDKLIPREIDRIESIARSLLEFSSTEDTVKDEEFYIDEPVKTVMSILEPQYRTSEIKIVCDFSKRHIVKGSKIRMQDIIFNIMNYVMAETPKGSSINIECAKGEKGLKLYIRSKGLIVADHIIKDVFEPVSSLHREKRGFGFNIFIAKQLIEKGGGELTISSDKSTGSEFCIRI